MKKWIISGCLAGLLVVLILALFGVHTQVINRDTFSQAPLRVGFFSPENVDEFIHHVDFSMMNAYAKTDPKTHRMIINLDHLKPNLKALRGLNHKLNINIGPVIAEIRDVSKLKRTYTTDDGDIRTKVFKPLFNNKLRNIVDNDEIESRFEGFVDLVKEYRDNIGVIFISDEPYLNGINKQELERAITKIRSLLERENIYDIKLGLIFAGAMFNSEFAKHIEDAFRRYVIQVDSYYQRDAHLLEEQSEEALSFKKWVSIFQQYRLTTYDTCSNVVTNGGIPRGLDVVAFDFYLSSLLFDHMYDRILDWLNRNGGCEACEYFAGKSIKDIRRALSFFEDGPVTDDKDRHKLDRDILDKAFNCRMRSTVDLLRQEIRNSGQTDLKIMLIGESSANGLLEFDAKCNREQHQPQLLVEQRMIDEVKRTFRYYMDNIDLFEEGVMFFLYADTYDRSIDLFVSGAKGAPNLLYYIYSQRNLILEKTYMQRLWGFFRGLFHASLDVYNHAPILLSLGDFSIGEKMRLEA